MRRLLPALLLLACDPATQIALPVEQTGQAIRNGTREPQALPLTEGQTLALGWLHPLGDAGSNFCSGTIIAPQFVATARHCVEGRRGARIGFGVGLLPSDPDASFRVETIFAHPQVDAAILRLASPVTDELPTLEPIAANRRAPWDGLIGSEVEAAGYGETYDRSRSGRYFAVVELERFSDDFVHVNGRGQQGICFGDSGGPVMAVDPDGDVVVLGVESSGDSSCLGRDRLTRLDILADWIDAIQSGEPPDDQCGDIDYSGRCDGTVAEWCENGIVRRQECANRGEVCDFVSEDVGFWCTDPPPCGEIGSGGICEGDTVARCRFGRLTYEDCARADQVCRTDGSGAFCAPADFPEDLPDAAPDAAPEPDATPDAAPAPDAVLIDAGLPDPGAGSEQRRARDEGCRSAPGAPASGWAWLLLAAPILRRRR